MKYLPFALALIATPAAAQVPGPLGPLTGTTALLSDGLGDAGTGQIPGIATTGSWSNVGNIIAYRHLFLYSGDTPYASGWVKVPLPNTFYPVNSDAGQNGRARAQCNVSPAWDGPEYTPAGYTNPEPWGLWLGLGPYDHSNETGPTINIIWMGQFPPRTVFTVWLSCGNRALANSLPPLN